MVGIINTPRRELTPLQAAERMTWQYRAVELCRGQQTQTGAILLAVLGNPGVKNPPRFGRHAVILDTGDVVARFEDRNRVVHDTMRVCSVEELTSNFSRLADELRLSDQDRIELFSKIRGWIAKDFRVDTNLGFTVFKR